MKGGSVRQWTVRRLTASAIRAPMAARVSLSGAGDPPLWRQMGPQERVTRAHLPPSHLRMAPSGLFDADFGGQWAGDPLALAASGGRTSG